MTTLRALRENYQQEICARIIRITEKEDKRYPNFADGSNVASTKIAWGILERLQYAHHVGVISGQTSGGRFEVLTCHFLEAAFELLRPLRPGEWRYSTHLTISAFDQYRHLEELESIVREENALASALGLDYIVKPDILVGRMPVSDTDLQTKGILLDGEASVASLTPLRAANVAEFLPMLHASISCKWTLRSDRGQNARTEALNLIRNRKGHTPHIVVVTAEPLPTRLATLALGTGDLDCIYHFALAELRAAVSEIHNADQLEMLNLLIEGRRLRDISDLPFDLAI